jgi:biotin carboxylase
MYLLFDLCHLLQNYANVPLIVDIAERMGVHAVWAGWFVHHHSFTNL